MDRVDILDHGFVRLVDVMPQGKGKGDEAVVQAARVSYGRGTKTVRDDEALIRYLVRHSHTSPFEMVEFKFHLKIPIFVARQLVRHRTASMNECSARYSVLPCELFVPDSLSLRKQSIHNRQGRSEERIKDSDAVVEKIRSSTESSYDLYVELLENHGLSRELARIVLPLSIYTEMYWKMDLNNLLKFLKLRLDMTAQEEMRELADAILGIITPYVPLTISAWKDYVLEAVTFSRRELEILSKMLHIDEGRLDLSGLSKGEQREFVEKLNRVRRYENAEHPRAVT